MDCGAKREIVIFLNYARATRHRIITSVNDKPGFPLVGVIPGTPPTPFTVEYGEYNGQWTVWLMFKPTGTDTDWVPIQKLTWTWNGSATLVVGSSPPQWTLNNISPPGDPTGSDTTEYPVWNRIFVSLSGGCTT